MVAKKCITANLANSTDTRPQITVNKVKLLRDGVETTTLKSEEDLSKYTFAANVTVSGSVPQSILIYLYIDNKYVIHRKDPGKNGTFDVSITGSFLKQNYSYLNTVSDLLKQFSSTTATSCKICLEVSIADPYL